MTVLYSSCRPDDFKGGAAGNVMTNRDKSMVMQYKRMQMFKSFCFIEYKSFLILCSSNWIFTD